MSQRSPVALPYMPCVVAAALFAALVASGASAQVRVTEVTPQSHPYVTLHCAREPVRFRMVGQALELVVRGESRVLLPAMSGSGARYTAPGNPDTEFWGKGPLTTITWDGAVLPTCTEVGAVVTPFRASGNEPFWAVEYTGWQLALERPGQATVTHDAQVLDRRADGLRVQAGSEPGALQLDLTEALCRDTMSGQSYPYRATLQAEGRTLQGCGGDPARLLQGVRWAFTQLNGAPVQAPAFIEFLPDGRVAGHSGCNRFFGEYAVSGEGLRLSGLGSTRMACDDAAMRQEDTLTRLLTGVQSFELIDNNTLQLNAADGQLQAQPRSMDIRYQPRRPEHLQHPYAAWQESRSS